MWSSAIGFRGVETWAQEGVSLSARLDGDLWDINTKTQMDVYSVRVSGREGTQRDFAQESSQSQIWQTEGRSHEI